MVRVRSCQNEGIVRFARLGQSLASVLLLAMLTAGCASRNVVAEAEVDRSLVTSSVGPADVVNTDEMTVRNAVTSTDIEGLSGKPIPFANLDTGATGLITAVTEVKHRGVVCRRFAGTMQRFDGVSAIRGEACLGDDGAWFMRTFERS